MQPFGRLMADIIVPPQTAMNCELHAQAKTDLRAGDVVQVTSIDTEFFGKEPGIFLINELGQIYENRKVKAVVVNNTTRQMTMKKGNVVSIVEKSQRTILMIILRWKLKSKV